MEIWLIGLFILAGAAAGTLAGLIGLGGGVFYVPLLVYSLNEKINPTDLPIIAVSTSLFIITLSLISSGYTHIKKGNVSLKPLPLLILGGALGAILASLSLKGIEAHQFKLLLSLLEIIIAVQLIRGAKKNHPQVEKSNKWLFIAIGFLGGLLSAFFGIGGGLIVMPLMHLFAGYKINKAVGVTTIYMIFATIVGLISHNLQIHLSQPTPGVWHNFYIPGIIALLPSAAIFNRIGALWVNRINPTFLKRGVGYLLIPISGINFYYGLSQFL